MQHDGPATPEQICLWLPVTGSLPQTTTTVCRYRRVGDSTWRQGHPLYRVQPALSTVPAVGGPVLDGFAWPMIDLTPGTTYEVEVSITSGSITAVRTLTHTTRALPPPAGTPTKFASTAAQIVTQLAALNPGDVLQIADGTHDVNGLTLSRSGTATSPIYIRGQSRQGTILRDTTGSIVALQSISNVVLENITLVGSGVDSGTNASSVAIDGGNSNYTVTNLTVRNVTANGIDRAVYMYGGAQGVLVYDCTFNGNNRWQTSPVNFLGTNLTWNDDGIHLTGSGNCAFNNTLVGFGDTFAYASHAGSDVIANAIAVHYYRNEIRNSCDDPIEVDHARRNCTWYDNRMHNVINCDSLDPLYGGPWLSARNITINPYRVSTHKWNDTNCGMFLYNNTIIGTASVGTDADVANWYQPNNGAQRSYGYRNNLHVYRGNGQSIWLESTNHDPIDWTHNSWYPDRRIQWGGVYSNLAAAQSGLPNTTPIFSGTTRRMQNDNITASNPWTQSITLGATSATEYAGTFLPALSPGDAAKNSGIAIPNITDGFAGSAPDRGAIIEGRSTPTFGDRNRTTDTSTPTSTGTSAMPAWRQGMAVGEWREIPNSALASAPMSVSAPGNTGPVSKVIAWCGFAIDTRDSTIYSAANGGHWDYAGNEVNSIRLSSDAPAWTERRSSSPVNMIVDSATHYADGSPTSRHSYYGILVNEARNRVMVLSGSRWGNGYLLANVDGFNIQQNSWDPARTFPDVPSEARGYGTPYVKQDASGDLYAFGNYGIYRWNNSANAWSTVASNGAIYGFEAAAALDTRRNRVLVLGGNGADQAVYTLGSANSERVTLSGVAAGSVGGDGNGMVYDPSMDAYLLRKAGAGSTVYRINAQTLAVDTLPTIGGSSIPSSTNGVYRRFQFAPQLGGIVYAPSYNGNLWFLRTT